MRILELACMVVIESMTVFLITGIAMALMILAILSNDTLPNARGDPNTRKIY
jgi:hypothetical protein